MEENTKKVNSKKCANCKFLKFTEVIPFYCRWHGEELEEEFINDTYCDAHEFKL